MTRKLFIHSHLLVGSMVCHLMICLQRLIVTGSLSGIPKMGVIDGGAGICGVGGIVSSIIFILFIIKCIRKRIPKLVFVCLIVFNLVVDLAGAILFCIVAFMNLTPNKNVHMFACGCLVTLGVCVVLQGIVIALLFVFKSGLKSYRPVKDDNSAKSDEE